MKKIILFLCLAFAGISCTKNYFVYDDIESRVYFLQSGIVNIKLTTKSCDAVVVKGGYTKDTPSVSVSVDESSVSEYNEKYGTSFKIMPSRYYSFMGGSAKVDETSCIAVFPVSFELEDLEPGLWMLPLRLTSEDVSVNADKDVVMFTIEIK